eukprot:XP_011675650.1 PREDICTED: calponin homology domain-containing protein DDB_G0272472 isoform X6 [Strongylocentrotus purpuratus]
MFTLQPTVVSKSSNPGLSLLSRGIGEEKEQHGQTKLEVCLEPEDYHNIQGRRFYLPPLQQHAWAKESKQVSPREVRVHKTYTTRKGALLLYAEDLALTSQEGADGKKRSMEAEDSSYFNSISDLRNAVLSYGSGTRQQTFQPAASQVDPSHQPFLGFVHNKRSHGPYKTVRPGFSAKRYLANWSRSWDDSILNYLRSEGHIWDKNLFQQNVLAPNLYRRINDDLSLVPLPYRVTRNMLMSPGEFESLEFYRIRPDGADTGGYDDDDGYDADVDATEKGSKGRKKKKSIQKPFNLPGSIAMIVRDMEQKPHAVQYEQLDEEQQRQVLQRLLLQSALHQQQHLRIIREENEKKKEEETVMEEEGENSATSSQKRPMPILSGQPKQRRTDTDMTLYGSPTFQVPDAQDIDMEQAIANLITSNSTNILGGSTAFTDQTILDMYSAMKGKTKKPPAPPPSTSPSQWPQGSKRGRVKNNMYHTYPANFSGIQPLPPIQNSLEGNMGGGGDFMWPTPPPKQGTGPPVITMEPPTPQHPLLSGKSKFSQGWSSRSKTLSKSSVQSSSETNIWKADIDENDLLQEAEREDIEHERASSDQEVWIKSPRSSTKGSSKKASSKDSAVSKASKGSGESIIALSINSHFSHSMENLASPVGDQKPRFPAAGSVPARLRESMRSNKGSGRGSSHGCVLLGDQGGDFLITGSKQGSSYAPSVDSLADNVPSPVEAPTPQEPPSISQELPSIESSESLEVPDASTLDAEEIFEEKADIGSTDNVAGSPEDDDAHSVKTDEFLSEADDTKTTGRSVKLGQGVIDLTMSEPAESVRDKMSEKRSLPSYSKKSSTQGSVKAESLQSGKDDDELGQLSDGEKDEEWPGQADQSKTGSVTGQDDDQQADMSSKRRSSVAGSESEVEIEVEAAGDGNEENGGEPGEGGDNNSGLRTSSLLEPPASVAGSVRSRSGSVEAQLEQLVEAASVIVDEIMQRPKSGRDLAKDAMMAAEIWSAKLGELFDQNDDPERVRSAPYRRRQNSLDEESVTSDMSSKGTKRSRRIHSAEAAVTLLRHLLKGSKSAEGKKEDAGGDGAKDSGPLGFSMTNLGVAEKIEAEKTTLIVRAPPEPEKPADDADAKLNDELAKIVAETGLLEKRGSKSKKGSMSTKTSTKSNKSSKSSKSKKGKDGEDEEDKDAFIVSLPKDSKADILLYKPMTPEPPKEEPKPPPKEKKKPIQKKTKKPAPKQEKPKKTKKPPKEPSESPKDNKQVEEEEAKLKAEKEKQEEEERKKKEEEEKAAKEAAEREGEEDEEEEDEGRASPESPEFIIVQDPPSLPPELPVDEIKLEPSVSAAPSEDYSEITDFTEDSTNEGPNSISRSQAKAFKRAAEAEKRKAAVEKKRRDRDEAKKRAQGEAERAERIKQEYEDEKKRKEAEALERAARAVEEREKLANQEEERKRQAALAAERERRQQAEYKRKMEEMARKKREEDMKRKAEDEQRKKEEAERMRIEAEMLAAMEEAERIEFEKRRKAEELEAARIAEEERIKREIEDKIAEEKARLLAIELAKQQKEVEARLAFNKELHSEANVFTHSQDMTRAFTWSYFELLEHLGIDIPDSLKDHYKEIAESKGDG